MLRIEDLFIVAGTILLLGGLIALFLKVTPFQLAFWGLFYCYCVVVLGLTLFPIPYQGVEALSPVPHNFVPFRGIASTLSAGLTSTALLQIGGNLLLAVPYGVMLDLARTGKKKRLVVPLAFLFPLVIELLQLLIGFLIGVAYRSFDVDDLLLNSLGAAAGVVLSKVILKSQRNKIHRKLFPR